MTYTSIYLLRKLPRGDRPPNTSDWVTRGLVRDANKRRGQGELKVLERFKGKMFTVETVAFFLPFIGKTCTNIKKKSTFVNELADKHGCQRMGISWCEQIINGYF